jgi:hypothetical protein
LDATPVVLLAATVGWISLVTMEFYEKIYRPKIDANLDKLKDVGEAQLQDLLKDVEARIRKGKSDINALEGRAGVIVSILNADEQLVNARKNIFLALFVASLFSIAASYSPDFPIISPVTLSGLGYLACAIVFVYGFVILKRIFRLDKELLAITKARRESSTRESSETTQKSL